MATVLPPPSKRQKLDALVKSRTQQDVEEVPADAGQLRVRFIDATTGEPSIEGHIMVSVADADPKKLALLLNTLKGRDKSDHLSYRFALNNAEGVPEEQITAETPYKLWKQLTAPGATGLELDLNITASEQAVFKVQAVSRCSASISGHGEAILATQFSPRTSSRMVTGSGDNTARIWDCDTGTPVHTLKGHRGWILAVSWAPDESKIATGSYDNSVRLWDPKTGKQLGKTMTGHTKWVRALSWEPYHAQKPGQPRLASASKDSTIRVWSANQQTIEHVLSGHKGSVSSVKWGGRGWIYTAADDMMVKIWNADDGTLVHTLKAHASKINHLALSTDFALRTGYFDHTSKEPATDEEKVKKAEERFMKAASIGGEVVERLVSASDDFTMHLWEPSKSLKPVARMHGHQKQVNHVTFSPDGTLIASSGFDNHTKIWNARDGKFINTLRGHVAPVYQCAFSADSRLLVTASKDTTLKVWSMNTYKLANDLPGHKDEVFAVDWSPDGQKVGSGGADKAVRLWRN